MSQLYMPESYPSIVYYVTSTYFCFMLYVNYKLYFSISTKKYVYYLHLERTFLSRWRKKQSRIHTIMYQDIYIHNNEAKIKKKWFPLGFISLFNTVWMLWFLFISIILHFIGDIPFLLQFNTLLTLELRPRGDPDTSLKTVKWQSTRRTLQQHNGIFFVFLATLEAVKLALDKNSKRVCVQWNSIECGYICSTVLKNWSTVQFTSLWKLRKNSRIIAKNGTIGHLTSWFYSHEI